MVTAFLTVLRGVPWPVWRLGLEACAVVTLILGLYGYGHHHGETSGRAAVQAKWDAAEKARAADEAKRKAANDETALKATAEYKAATAAITARHANAASNLRSALAAPACPVAASAPGVSASAAAALGLGDLRIGRSVVGVLRDAAGGSGVPPKPSTGDLSRAMLRGAGIPGPRS